MTISSTGGPAAAEAPGPTRPISPAERSVDATVAASVVNGVKEYRAGSGASVVALDSVTVRFRAGAFTAIMGPSGSGKSSLMHCAAGLDRLTAGQVRLGDTELGGLSDRQLTLLRRTRIGFVFQAFNLIPTLTVRENVVLPLELAGRRADPALLEDVTRRLGLLDRLRHRPSELSGGEQQRVAVARALVSRPEIIFADEPTGNLDSATGAAVLEFLGAAVRERGQTIVMVTHDPIAAAHADRVVFLRDGKVVDEVVDPAVDQLLDTIRRLGR
jgi:putative ABC transport system ATP-binding protein